jgi:pimeloyl-ACP methyl ester carboxylesterase
MGAMTGGAQYQDVFWWSEDGVRLHARDYPGRDDRPPIVCIPGLTRNARDFHHVAERLAGEWRVICVDLRGRGESGYAKLPLSYTPLTYMHDVGLLFESLSIAKAVFFGTSLGGLVTMMTALSRPDRIAAALINDIGPVIEEAGLRRIRGFVGKSANWPSWVHAARGIAAMQSHAHPDYDLVKWIEMAKRMCRLTPQGRIVPDYDMQIAVPMREAAEPFDLWPAIDALADKPVTVLRGATSDILSQATAKAMVQKLANGVLASIPLTGHPPELDEPAAVKAIDALLKRVA